MKLKEEFIRYKPKIRYTKKPIIAAFPMTKNNKHYI